MPWLATGRRALDQPSVDQNKRMGCERSGAVPNSPAREDIISSSSWRQWYVREIRDGSVARCARPQRDRVAAPQEQRGGKLAPLHALRNTRQGAAHRLLAAQHNDRAEVVAFVDRQRLPP